MTSTIGRPWLRMAQTRDLPLIEAYGVLRSASHTLQVVSIKTQLPETMKRHFKISTAVHQDLAVLRHRDAAFTLFELMIVLAIIVAVTAMAAPSMMERVRSGRVQEAAEDVREVLASCRTYAIESGVDYHFRFESGGHFAIAIPAEQNVSLGNSSDADDDTAEFLYRSVELPETIFLRTRHDDTSGSETLEGPAFGDLSNSETLKSKNWSMPVLFRFDGSAEDKTFRVMDEQQRSCEISVRGLTGAISLSGVFIMEEN
jgi:prepilin-type N-terminal cleavage/methylation domain-containing protein